MLETKKLRKTEFIRILKTFEVYTEYVKDINPYKTGYWNKNTIYYTEEDLICTESHLKYLDLLEGEDYTDWKQIIIHIDTETINKKVQPELTGTLAKAVCIKALRKVYSIDELDKIINSYDTKYDFEKKQFHILPDRDGLTIYKNCTGYDINGAHNDALVEIFPKAANYFSKLFEERKLKPNNKKIVNYFVGILKYNNEGLYNYIVQRTTAKLIKGIQYVDGTTLYANTDGFITQHPLDELEDSKELGKWKIEVKGDVYVYRDTNYWVIQYINTKGELVTKGNVLNEVRDKINLFEGKVVHYKKIKNEFKQYIPVEITEETVKGDIIC